MTPLDFKDFESKNVEGNGVEAKLSLLAIQSHEHISKLEKTLQIATFVEELNTQSRDNLVSIFQKYLIPGKEKNIV